MLAQEDQHQNQMMMIKGKRTKRQRPASPLTLTMSTTASGDQSAGRVATSSSTTSADAGAHVCGSPTEEEEDMAHCLILLAQGASKTETSEYSPAVISVSPARMAATAATTVGSGGARGGLYVYECKTCNRCFLSFQALGGHRASHKKPKLPAEEKGVALSLMDEKHQQQPEQFQSPESGKNSGIDGVGLSLQVACNSSNTLSASNNHNDNNKSKVHACAICGAEFSSGQALGGHMRRHRSLIIAGAGSPAVQSASPPAPPRNLLSLDLNLPADEQEHQQPQPESPNFMFASKEKTLVLAASLVDCRY